MGQPLVLEGALGAGLGGQLVQFRWLVKEKGGPERLHVGLWQGDRISGTWFEKEGSGDFEVVIRYQRAEK
jgi:hypothetical protein